jgi:nucleoside-diphosphate-sugar epimerase
MTKHVIVGAGPIGSGTARLLAERGDHVTLVSRSGSGPDVPGVLRVRADATDATDLTDLAAGAGVLYNCASPPYHRWANEWPPLADALLATAQRCGAVLATVSNLYGYGRVDGPITENTPLNPHGPKGRVRAQMWLDALAAHQAGRVRVTEIRASDYIGPHAQSHLGARVVPRLLAGKGVQVLSSADSLHTWTYVDDVARLLATAGTDERAWGRPWHVPSNPPRTQREAVDDLARAAGASPVKVAEVPSVLLRAMGLFNPVIRELPEVAYQLQQPFVMDSSAAQDTFGSQPTPWHEVLAATVAHYRRQAR